MSDVPYDQNHLRHLAGEIITAQKKEIGEIDRWLKQHAGK